MPDNFAPEIEKALVSLCWHQPELLGTVLRQLEPEIHFPIQAKLFRAIECAYRFAGGADWASVIQLLREEAQLEALGELQALNDVYAGPGMPGYECLLEWYIELLKEYGEARKANRPPLPVHRQGNGRIWNNKNRRFDSQPELLGEFRLANHFYSVRGYAMGDGQFNLQIDPLVL